MTDNLDDHYNMTPRRKAEFFPPKTSLKLKAGTGGLSENILNKAQALLEGNTHDFRPLGEMYLESMMRGVEKANDPASTVYSEEILAHVLYPVMQLKANGGMFHYPLVTSIADRLIQFLEVIETLDKDAIEIVQAFHTTIRAILLGQIRGDGGARGAELMQALVEACYRYFEKHPDNRNPDSPPPAISK
ncbi:MAG: hypothetical protein KBC88_00205 [Alphaproteobacteria bacterium]|jgi:hypothetical protein|nr:hypothetical protein [Alphaproteobacteria bacterium]MBP9867337.1 hypothetical protein [Alphaproteobacteria bacterium]